MKYAMVERFQHMEIAGGEKIIGFVDDISETKAFLKEHQLCWLPDTTGGYYTVSIASTLTFMSAIMTRYRLMPIAEGVTCE